MQEPSPRTSRLAIAAGIAAAAMLAGAGFLAGRQAAPQPQPPAPVTTAPPLPAPEPAMPATLDRAALLAMVARAADAFASNAPVPPEIEAAAGQRFDLVLPFGCAAPGATESPGDMRWRFDQAAATLRITVDPALWQAGEWRADGVAGPSDAVFRGFWIARPWST